MYDINLNMPNLLVIKNKIITIFMIYEDCYNGIPIYEH